MSLYLCLFDGDRELDGVEAGSYGQFNAFRESAGNCAKGGAPSLPTLLGHSDCDGEWTPRECGELLGELAKIEPGSVARFVDPDGAPLLGSLRRLAEIAVERQLPILFQ
jgi:hypothetical protein